MAKMILNGIEYAGIEINDTQPIGEIIDSGSDEVPLGYLPCDGRSLLRSEYPELFKAIGTKYGAVDAQHFNLPNEDEDVCTSGLTVVNISSGAAYRFRRKGNVVYFEVSGYWSGTGASSATAELIKGLPARFRPTPPSGVSYVSTTPIFAYSTGTSPYCFVGRGIVLPDGSFKIGEHGWPTGSRIIGIGYYLIDGDK